MSKKNKRGGGAKHWLDQCNVSVAGLSLPRFGVAWQPWMEKMGWLDSTGVTSLKLRWIDGHTRKIDFATTGQEQEPELREEKEREALPVGGEQGRHRLVSDSRECECTMNQNQKSHGAFPDNERYKEQMRRTLFPGRPGEIEMGKSNPPKPNQPWVLRLTSVPTD